MELSMKRLIPLFCLAACLTAARSDRPAGEHRAWDDIDHWVEVFEDPARDEWQKPLIVLDFLGIEGGDVIADLGAGTGYFTKPLSIQVGQQGKVFAVDIERAMLDHLMQREDIVTERVVPVLAKRNDPKLPAGQIDLVVVVNTWHHIEKRSKYLRHLQECLSPVGRVAIIDFREGELPVGPPPGHKLSRDQVVSEFEKADWRLVAESVALPYQYVMTFLPPPRRDTRGFLGR
jgi:ubiquinone/menaquinone biosynthesis C-methylase UbiE